MKINESMLCWNDQTGDVKIVQWPDNLGLSEGYSSVGACHRVFHSMTKTEKQLALISEAMWLVENSGISMREIYAALMQIDECREALTQDPFLTL